MDQQLDAMLYHTGRYSSLLARRLQGQDPAAAASAAASSAAAAAAQAAGPAQAAASPAVQVHHPDPRLCKLNPGTGRICLAALPDAQVCSPGVQGSEQAGMLGMQPAL